MGVAPKQEAAPHAKAGVSETCVAWAPFAGLFTYGEIARIRGVNALHSQTFVAMAIG